MKLSYVYEIRAKPKQIFKTNLHSKLYVKQKPDYHRRPPTSNVCIVETSRKTGATTTASTPEIDLLSSLQQVPQDLNEALFPACCRNYQVSIRLPTHAASSQIATQPLQDTSSFLQPRGKSLLVPLINHWPRVQTISTNNKSELQRGTEASTSARELSDLAKQIPVTTDGECSPSIIEDLVRNCEYVSGVL